MAFCCWQLIRFRHFRSSVIRYCKTSIATRELRRALYRFGCMQIRSAFLIAVVMAAFGPGQPQAPPAWATSLAETVPLAPQRPVECAPSKEKPNAQEGITVGQANEALGDKLARSDGVLCPPAGVDPEIRAPTPDTGNTPVIPPPGSPGGDQSVRPK